ncbi:MAG: shikimate kinase [Gemmataceae bacterium]|jgi:shikimate kinase|nr:shikimate kinase [Gemmataceae bacterium]
MAPPLLFLVGLRGSGKSTIGQKLSQRLGYAFFDADQVLEQRLGQTIQQIFAQHGEPYFRDWEQTILEELAQPANRVVATGGGVVLRESNRAILKQGFVIWLDAPAEILWQRIQTDTANQQRRPNLTSLGGLAELQQLAQSRRPLYQQVANLCIPVGSVSPDDAVNAILAS